MSIELQVNTQDGPGILRNVADCCAVFVSHRIVAPATCGPISVEVSGNDTVAAKLIGQARAAGYSITLALKEGDCYAGKNFSQRRLTRAC